MISVFMSAWSFYSSGLRGDNQWLKPALVFATSSRRMFQTFLFHCFCFVCFFSSVAVLTPGYKSHYPSLRNRKHRNLTVWGFYRIFHLVILWHAGTSPMIGSKRLTSLTVIRVQGFFCSTTELCHLLPNDAELNVYLAFFTDALTWKQSNSALSFSLSPLTVWGKTDWSASAFIYLITLSFVCTAWLNLSFHCQPGLVEHTHTQKKTPSLYYMFVILYWSENMRLKSLKRRTNGETYFYTTRAKTRPEYTADILCRSVIRCLQQLSCHVHFVPQPLGLSKGIQIYFGLPQFDFIWLKYSLNLNGGPPTHLMNTHTVHREFEWLDSFHVKKGERTNYPETIFQGHFEVALRVISVIMVNIDDNKW